MKQHIQGLLCLMATGLLAACQSNETPPPTIISNTFAQEAEPRILNLAGIKACGGIVKSNIEVIYTGSWREKNGEEALPHTLVIMKPEGLSNSVYYASGIWKPWGAKKPSCDFLDVIRDGNTLTIANKLRGGKASARYQLNGETATGEYENGGKTWPITMTRYWADGIDELGGFDLEPNGSEF
jgi:hypothetical protein